MEADAFGHPMKLEFVKTAEGLGLLGRKGKVLIRKTNQSIQVGSRGVRLENDSGLLLQGLWNYLW